MYCNLIFGSALFYLSFNNLEVPNDLEEMETLSTLTGFSGVYLSMLFIRLTGS